MIKNFSKVRIINTKARQGEGRAMQKLLQRKNENVDIEIAYDPIGWGAWKTYRLALNIDDDADWLIIMEDDISFPVDVLQRIDHILNSAPKDAWVFFYVPTNKDTIEAYESGKHAIKCNHHFWPQCTAVPLTSRKHFIENIDEIWWEESESGDGRIKKYLVEFDVPAYTILPSLFQHLGTWRSSLGYSGKVGKWVRQSFCFEPDSPTFEIDWDKAFAEPYIDKRSVGAIGFKGWRKGDSVEGYNDGGIKK